jgi:hypothetical protein
MSTSAIKGHLFGVASRHGEHERQRQLPPTSRNVVGVCPAEQVSVRG